MTNLSGFWDSAVQSSSPWRPADHSHVSIAHLQSHPAHPGSLHLFVISMCKVHLFCSLGRDGGRRQGLYKLLYRQTAPLRTSQKKKDKTNTHHLCRLTNVPWHSYITHKLAKWINHGPCLALRALNGFSPLQVCPIIAFIHLVEARFTLLQRSCQSPGYIFRSGGRNTRDLSSDHNS